MQIHGHTEAAADQFRGSRNIVDVRPYGSGNVHETFLVGLDRGSPFILQRLNTRVFPRPDLVMGNIRAVTEHVSRRLSRQPLAQGRRWDVPAVLLTRDGHDCWADPSGSFWRALGFVGGAHSRETIRNAAEAGEVGWALGTFQALLSDLPADRLADTLEGFHVTPLYLRRYEEVLAVRGAPRSPEVDFCLRFVRERASCVNILEETRARGSLGLRVIHGDPKVNNVLFDDATGRAVALVDLDTVKPGLVHYDIGDCLRSGCNPLGEETERWEDVRFEVDLCRAMLGGYLSAASGFLTREDSDLICDAVRLIAFELGLRFFTDYLEGNVYFRVRDEGQNLARALVQFRLTESIEAQEPAIRAIVRALA